MKPIDEIETIQDILDAEKEMVSGAESKYGRDFQNVAGFNDLINNFLKEAKPNAWVFMVFLSQIKKYHTLALFSVARLHHIQAMLNLRQVLEAGVNAAYGLANPNQDDFVIKNADGTLDTSDALNTKRYKWIGENHKKHSDFMHKMKKSINESCAHSNMIYAFNNFQMADYKFHTDFFDKSEEHHVKADFFMVGNIALGLLDLFYGINKSCNQLTFIDDFIPRLKALEKVNQELKAEAEKHPRFQRFLKRDDENN